MTAAPGPQQPDEGRRWCCDTPRRESHGPTCLVFHPAAPSAQPDPWCREESCEYRHWTSGSMPTHKRGSTCPAPAQPVRDTGERRR